MVGLYFDIQVMKNFKRKATLIEISSQQKLLNYYLIVSNVSIIGSLSK